MRRVDLTVEELRHAYGIAVQRMASNLGAGVRDQKLTDRSPWQIHIDGAIGELAFARMFNVYPDFGISPRAGSPDFVVRQGGVLKTVDVKTRRRVDGDLMVPLHKAKPPARCDLYVLMIVDDCGAWCAGWTPADALFRPENIKDYGKGPTYAMEQACLIRP